MISKVYTIYDGAIEAYMQPFLAQTKGHAIRMFSDSVNDPQSQLFRHAKDFTLFEIGEYDDSKGVYSMHEAKVSMGVALEFKKQLDLPDPRQQELPTVVK